MNLDQAEIMFIIGLFYANLIGDRPTGSAFCFTRVQSITRTWGSMANPGSNPSLLMMKLSWWKSLTFARWTCLPRTAAGQKALTIPCHRVATELMKRIRMKKPMNQQSIGSLVQQTHLSSRKKLIFLSLVKPLIKSFLFCSILIPLRTSEISIGISLPFPAVNHERSFYFFVKNCYLAVYYWYMWMKWMQIILLKFVGSHQGLAEQGYRHWSKRNSMNQEDEIFMIEGSIICIHSA